LPTLSHRRWPLAALVVQRALLRLRRLRGPVRRGGPNAQLRLACCWSAMAGLSMVSPLGSAEYQSRYLRLALATGDARGIALGMAFEAMGAAATARTAAPAHRLLAEMERWTRDLDEPLVRAYAAVARGTVAFLTAQWRTALEHCDNAERIFRDDCIGAAWEIGSAQRVSLTCLWHLARIDELRRRVGAAMDEAERRRDLYAMTQLRTVLVPNLRLMDDRSDLARAELARAGDDLAQRGIHLQHWQHMQATALVELYAGDPMAAARHLEEKLPAMRRAFLLRVRAVRGFTHFVQGTACIAAAARGGPESARWRRRADSVRRHLDRDGELAAAALLAAGLAILSRDRAQAIHQLQIAADAFAALDMGLVGAAARWRLAELQDRHDGPGSVAAIEAEMTAQGIVCPRRVVAMLAPLPAS